MTPPRYYVDSMGAVWYGPHTGTYGSTGFLLFDGLYPDGSFCWTWYRIDLDPEWEEMPAERFAKLVKMYMADVALRKATRKKK